jgi:hypothetical protein
LVKYLTLIFIFSFLSCSTTSFKDFWGSSDESLAQRNDELMKDFEVQDNVLEKFKETKAPKIIGPEIKPVVNKKRMNPEPRVVKTLRVDKNKKKITTQKIKLKTKVKLKSKTKHNTSVTVKPKYPESFPERLISFDKRSEKYWNDFKPILFPGERTVLDISYMGGSIGKITLSTKNQTKIGETEVYHVNARVKTADFYSYLYELDDYCDSYIRKDNFKPLKFSLIQRQSAQNIDDLQLFDHDELKTYSFYKRITDEKTKKKKSVGNIPLFFQDPLSIVYFIRGLPMIPGQNYEIPIVNKGKVELLIAKIDKQETIKTKIGKMSAIKVSVLTKHKGKTIEGGKMTFWYSNDAQKIFLRFKAKIKIGSVSGEINSYKK